MQSGPTVAKILQGRPTVAPISQDPSAIPTLISDQERRYGQLPLYQRLQRNLTWWEKFANPQVVKLIREGISIQNLPPILSQKHQVHSQKEVDLAKTI